MIEIYIEKVQKAKTKLDVYSLIVASCKEDSINPVQHQGLLSEAKKSYRRIEQEDKQ